MTKKRLFIAVDLSDAVKKNIYRICNDIKGIRWTKRGQLHLTLRFIGDTPEDKVTQLSKAMDSLDFSAFDLTVSGTGFFRPNIFFLSLDEVEALSVLKKQIDDLLNNMLDMESEKRDFVPHITLSRLKKRLSSAEKAALQTSFSPIFPEGFSVDRVTLYASELKPDGAVHTPLKIVSSR
jgi:2'-5' RNA ligase